MTDPRTLGTFAEFYPFYLSEHSNITCRRLHFLGSSLSLLCLAMLFATGKPQYFLYGLLCGYGCAWVGHFVFEKNKPASCEAGPLHLMQLYRLAGHPLSSGLPAKRSSTQGT